MIVRGIVSDEELQQIKDAAVFHKLQLNEQDGFRSWTEDGATWVEVDVHDDVLGYLQRSGFFDGVTESKSNRKEETSVLQTHIRITCPYCGNDNVDQIQHSTEQSSYVFRNLVQSEDGSIYVEDDVYEVVEAAGNTGTNLYCLKCDEYFTDPGLETA